MKNYFLLLPIIFIITISGCTSFVETGNGIVIKNFEPEFNPAFSTEDVNFLVRIKNTGSFRTTNGELQLIGLEEWGPSSPNEPNCLEGFSMQAPDAFYGVDGETKQCTFTLRAPDVPTTLTRTYDPYLRVHYDYHSSTVKSVTIFSRDELVRYQNQNKPLPTDHISSTRGPININLDTQAPIVALQTQVIFPLTIEVRNDGGGVVCIQRNCKDSTQQNKLLLNLFLGRDMASECDNLELSIPRGQSNTIVCKITVSNIPTFGFIKKTIEVNADYSYFVEKQASITIQSKPVS